MRTLYGLRQSPWTERARWALDHHGIVYTYHEHVPMLGELFLRRKAKVKKPTVPLLADGDDAIMGSFEIAKHAERIGRSAPLFPQGKDLDIAHWNDVAERMTRVGRMWVMRNLLTSRDAQRESLPTFIPDALRGALAPTSAMAIRFLAKKHAVSTDVEAEIEHTLRPAMEDLRKALEGKSYLLDIFTYADIAIAATLQIVRPHEQADLPPGTREAWTNDALAKDFEDLLSWRDTVVRKHR
jgi:glutathione S-transferase